jgi:hypothetical protein
MAGILNSTYDWLICGHVALDKSGNVVQYLAERKITRRSAVPIHTCRNHQSMNVAVTTLQAEQTSFQ